MTRSGPAALAALSTAALMLATSGAGKAHQQTRDLSISLSGRVVSAATGQPVPAAFVTTYVSDAILRAGVAADGTFRVGLQEPGRYFLGATAPGYLSARFSAAGSAGATLVAVAAGQHVNGLEIRLHRGATIAGTVTDSRGEPVAGAVVRAFSRRPSQVRGFQPLSGDISTQATTDDRGTYRIVGLEPNDYVVGVVDEGLVTFAPQTGDIAAAAALSLATDEVREAVSIQLPARDATIDGQVTGLPSAMRALQVKLLAAGHTEFNGAPAIVPDADGRFRFSDLPAGRYRVLMRPGPNAPPSSGWDDARATVAAGATTQVSLDFRPVVTVTGTITSVGLRELALRLVPVGLDQPAASIHDARIAPSGSWSITGVVPGRYRLDAQIREMTGVLLSHKTPRVIDPGVHRLLPEVRLNGADVTDGTIDVTARMPPLRIDVTEAAARITGRVLDTSGAPTSVGSVIVVPADVKAWTPYSRRVAVVRADTNGVYHVTHLPAGRYRVAHAGTATASQLLNPFFLRGLRGGREVSIKPLEVATVDLRATGR